MPRLVTALSPALCLALSAAASGEGSAPLQLDDDPAEVTFSLDGRAIWIGESDLDDGGTVGVVRLGPTLGVRYMPGETWFLDLSAGAEFSFYDFDGATTIVPGGDPAGDFGRYSLGARYTARASDDWWWFVGGAARWSAEDGADIGESFTASGTVGATYAVNDRLTIGVGLAVRSRLEDDVQVFPVPVLDWQISDQWSLATVDRAVRLSYEPGDAWTVFLQGGWESREYRLSEDGPIPDGVMRDDRIPVELGVIWRANSHIDLTGTIGVSAWNSYEFLDATGTEIADTDSDPALMAGLAARLRF